MVIKPANYINTSLLKYPTIYLLHGYSGNYRNWIQQVPSLNILATTYKCIIVCPDGGFSSWYINSPIDTTMQYETFVATELVNYIDTNYQTIQQGTGRAITGLSMGGFGAMYLALNHPKTFGACGSMSGALDIEKVKMNYDITKRWGDTLINKKYYQEHNFSFIIKSKKRIYQSIILDCGTNDAFLPMARSVHELLISLKIKHTYLEQEGGHHWGYWGMAIPYQMLFFHHFFRSSQGKY